MLAGQGRTFIGNRAILADGLVGDFDTLRYSIYASVLVSLVRAQRPIETNHHRNQGGRYFLLVETEGLLMVRLAHHERADSPRAG